MAKNITLKAKLQGAQKTKKGLKGIDSGLKSLGKSALVAGAAFFGARAIISGLKTVVRLAGEQEQAEKRLSTALGRTSKALLDQASALQKVTTFGDEAIIGVQASLAAFIKNEDQIKKATEATLDMAVAMGMDLKAAGDLVAKTLGSSTNAMSRYGIVVEGAVGSTERLESLTSNVAKLFGGQAKAQAETMAGALEQMENAAGDTGEKIGQFLSPAITSMAIGFTGAAVAVGDYIEQLRLSNTALSDAANAEERIAIIQAKLIEARAMDITNRSTGLIMSSKESEQLALITSLETDLALAREGNWFDLDEQFHKNMENLNEQAEMMKFLLDQKEAEIVVGDLLIEQEDELAEKSAARSRNEITLSKQAKQAKEDQLIADLKGAVLSGQSAKDAMKSVVRAESMEAVAGYISSIFQSVPLPYSLILAAGAGTVVAGIIDKGLSAFALGGDFVTSGPQMIMVGEAGRERVQVTPLQGPNVNGPQGGDITVNIMGGIIQDDYVRNELIPAINKAKALA